MNVRSQTFFLVIFILSAVLITRTDRTQRDREFPLPPDTASLVAQTPPAQFSYERDTVFVSDVRVEKLPTRNWDVLDPRVSAQSVLIQSLDDSFPFYHFNTYKSWPLASLTKLMTAVVVLEEIGSDKKIPVSQTAVATEGIAGDLKTGELYSSLDLLKIMLLTSSNDAAAAFEEYVGGREEFVKLLNDKARTVGMTQTLFFDASGLSDLNTSTASDILRLVHFIVREHPDIFTWTRLPHSLIQPLNEPRTMTVLNINPLVERGDFLGGKTGTSDVARENLIALFNFKNYRLVVIILGSSSRVRETESLFGWIEGAYQF